VNYCAFVLLEAPRLPNYVLLGVSVEPSFGFVANSFVGQIYLAAEAPGAVASVANAAVSL
jgi:hypothetical protein